MAKAKKTEEEILDAVEQETAPVIEPETPETEEVAFLRRLLQIQDEGGWGKHLHGIINERINLLDAK